MTFITRITTVEELKQIFIEGLLNSTNKITKVSDASVNNGIAFGSAKVAQKALKEIALIESNIFPDVAFDESLDRVADNLGVSPRFGASGSSTYVRVVGDVGTAYNAGTSVFGNNGVNFILDETVVIDDTGFAYVKVSSVDVGIQTNVAPFAINKISPVPTGHIGIVNEYQATGGRNQEDDDLFRKRIKDSTNSLSRGSLSYLEQVFISINNNVLRLFFRGFDEQSNTILDIATQNGATLSQSELDELLNQGGQFFCLSDLKQREDASYKVVLKNVEYQTIDVDFRVVLDNSFNPDEVRIEIQTLMSKEIDFRFWVDGAKVEADNLLEIAKGVRGVNYVADEFFIPASDVSIERGKLPRIRGFTMRDIDGNVISDTTGILSPVFYPNSLDDNFISNVVQI